VAARRDASRGAVGRRAHGAGAAAAGGQRGANAAAGPAAAGDAPLGASRRVHAPLATRCALARRAGTGDAPTPLPTSPSYNLRRKVAGLPPVTQAWYDARAAALAVGGAGADAGPRSWLDPLTRKRFASEATYKTFVASNKYKDLVRASGGPAPAPVVTAHAPREPVEAAAAPPRAPAAAPGFRVDVPNGATFETRTADAAAPADAAAAAADGAGWETASDSGDSLPADWVEWDPKRSLFDNKLFDRQGRGVGRGAGNGGSARRNDRPLHHPPLPSPSVEACLEHMWKTYGFYLPDAAFLADAEGLLSYLGSKLANGRVALHARGDDAGARVWPSLHAVQRHMVDSGQVGGGKGGGGRVTGGKRKSRLC